MSTQEYGTEQGGKIKFSTSSIELFVDRRTKIVLGESTPKERNWSTSVVVSTNHFIKGKQEGMVPVYSGEDDKEENNISLHRICRHKKTVKI